MKNKIFLLCGLLAFLSAPAFAQTLFEEHFEGEELDMQHWNYEGGDGCPDLCGWGNNERQIYDRNYVKVEDGKLVITAVKKGDNYFSGKINSKDKVEFQYGIVEIRAKLPQGHGVWPALWMLGSNISKVGWPASGEIDMMEYVGREPNTLFNALHTPASHGDTENLMKTHIEDIEEGYHTYKTVWTEKDISFYIDGRHTYTFVPKAYDEEHYPFRQPFYFLLNMAVGGNFGGPEVDDEIFPQRFYVDYIKVTAL